MTLRGYGVGWGRMRGRERGGFSLFVCFFKQLLDSWGHGWKRRTFRLHYCTVHWQIPTAALSGYAVGRNRASSRSLSSGTCA